MPRASFFFFLSGCVQHYDEFLYRHRYFPERTIAPHLSAGTKGLALTRARRYTLTFLMLAFTR